LLVLAAFKEKIEYNKKAIAKNPKANIEIKYGFEVVKLNSLLINMKIMNPKQNPNILRRNTIFFILILVKNTIP
jgi:hypothetical protein